MEACRRLLTQNILFSKISPNKLPLGYGYSDNGHHRLIGELIKTRLGRCITALLDGHDGGNKLTWNHLSIFAGCSAVLIEHVLEISWDFSVC